MARVWSAGGNLITARYNLGGCGTQDHALAFGGYPNWMYTDHVTEEYNSGVWSASGDLIITVAGHAGAGTQDAGLSFGGWNSGMGNTYVTAEYNGTSWSWGGNLALARNGLGGCGTQTAGLAFGGYYYVEQEYPDPPIQVTANYTEEYNGTSWSAGGNLIVATAYHAGAGTQDAGLSFGGVGSNTEEYNGTSWSAGGNLIVARNSLGGCGTQTAGLAFGGLWGSIFHNTEEYNGTSWSAVADLPTPTCQLAGAGTQSSGLAFGGSDGNTAPTNHTWVYAAGPSISPSISPSPSPSKSPSLSPSASISPSVSPEDPGLPSISPSISPSPSPSASISPSPSPSASQSSSLSPSLPPVLYLPLVPFEQDDFRGKLSFKFPDEVYVSETGGLEFRMSSFTFPSCTIEFTAGNQNNKTLQELSAIAAGVNLVTIPVWFLRTSLTNDAGVGSWTWFEDEWFEGGWFAKLSSGWFQIHNWFIGNWFLWSGATDDCMVESASNLYEGMTVFMIQSLRPYNYEFKRVASITGERVVFDSVCTFSYGKDTAFFADIEYVVDPSYKGCFASGGREFDYHSIIMDPSSGFLIPCVTGILNLGKIKSFGGLNPYYSAEITLKSEAQILNPLSEIPFFSLEGSSQLGVFELAREEIGIDSGILDVLNYLPTARKSYEITWDFVAGDSIGWHALRDLFLTAKGRVEKFRLPTWLHELRVSDITNSQGSYEFNIPPNKEGSTAIYIDDYQELWSDYPYLYILPRVNPGFTVFILSNFISNVFEIDKPLPCTVEVGDPICLCQQVRFASDELTFEFYGPDSCRSSVRFIEVPLE